MTGGSRPGRPPGAGGAGRSVPAGPKSERGSAGAGPDGPNLSADGSRCARLGSGAGVRPPVSACAAAAIEDGRSEGGVT